MTKILIFTALAASGFAQLAQPVKPVTTDPSGACANGAQLQYNYAAGHGTLWGCKNGVWTLISGSGGTTPTWQTSSSTTATETTANFVPGNGILQVGSNPTGKFQISTALDTAVALTRATDQAGIDRYARSTTGNDTYTATLTPTLLAYTRGSCFVLDADTANTGTASLNIDTLGALPILKQDGTALSNNDILANKPKHVCYDGTSLLIQGDGGGATSAISGGIIWPFGQMNGAGNSYSPATGSANVTQFYEFYAASPGVVINNVSGYFRDTNTPGHVAFAFYDSTCTIIASSTTATVNGSATTPTNFALPGALTLPGGKYFLALTSDVSTTSFYAPPVGFVNDIADLAESSSTFHYFKGTASTGTTTLVFPGTCGTRTSLGSGSTSGTPAIALH